MTSNSKVIRIVGFAAVGAILFGIDCGNVNGALVKKPFIKDFCAIRDWPTNSWPSTATCHPHSGKTCDKMADCSNDNPDGHITEPSGYTNFKALMGSLICLGSAFGAFVPAPPVARIGRRQCMFVGSLIASLGMVPQCGLVSSFALFLAARVISGVGVGMICYSLPMFISEIAPAAIRGTLGVSYQLVLMSGLLFATIVIAFDSVPYEVAFAMPIIPGVILMLGIFSLPASPRELLVKAMRQGVSDNDRNSYLAQAAASMEKIRNSPEEAADELQTLKEDLANQTERAPWSKLWNDKSIRRRMAVGNMLQWFQQYSGMNCLLVFGGEIFAGAGVPIPPLWAGVICNFCNFAGTIAMMCLIDRWGRRTLFHITTSVMTFFMFLTAALIYIIKDLEGEAKTNMGWVLLVSIAMTNLGFALGWGGGAWVYPSEIFPMDVKENAMSTTVFSQYFSNWSVVYLSGWLSKFLGYGGIFIFFGCFNLVGGILCHLMVKETKGKSLEEIGILFGAETALLPKVSPETEQDVPTDPAKVN